MNLVCIKCPRGCNLSIDNEGHVSGNLCPRGLDYAKEELTRPVRIVTALIKVKGKIVPVKTDREVPKDMIDNVLREISQIRVDDTYIGKIVLKNVLGTGANIIVTGDPYQVN